MARDTFTANVPKEIIEHPDFYEWRNRLDGSSIRSIEVALAKIKIFGIVQSVKSLGNGLFERKWNDGLRLYFAVVLETDGQYTLLLLGSGKGREQEAAIRRCKEKLSKLNVFKGSLDLKDE
ncbi:MAG: hypothetical protein ACLGG0_12985 [Bacteriovoracia bacterium]